MNAFVRLIACLIIATVPSGCRSGDWLDEALARAVELPLPAIGGLFTLGTFFSEDVTCVSAGVLVSRGVAPFWLAVVGCMTGVWLSDMGLYGVGVLGRRGLLDRAPLKWLVSRERLEKGSRLFLRHGAKMVVLSRFLPGSRVPLYVSAGFLGYPFARYAAWMALACVLWTPAMIYFAYRLGEVLMGWLSVYEKAAWVVFVAVVAAVWSVTRALEWWAARRLSGVLEAEEADQRRD